MRRIGRLPVTLAVLGLVTFSIGHSPALATEVLINGGLEESAGPENWTLTETITGMPGAPISATEHVDFANEPTFAPGELGLLVKSQIGNEGVYDMQNKKVNVNLSQTPAAVAGRTYTLTGHSFFQAAASGIISTLYADSPSGAVASPTVSKFELAFLDAGNAVVGTPVTLDLRSDTTTEAWRTHTLMGTAPAGSSKVRVTAVENDMVASCTTACPAGQDVYFDNFSLKDSTFPTFERLQNGNLNILGAPTGFTVQKTAEDNIQFSTQDYAIHTGIRGIWLRSFAGGDAKVLQTVPGTPGGSYTFSGFSKWETGYIGADPFSSTQTFMTLEFLDGSSAVIGSPVSLDLRTVQVNDGTWRQFSVPTTTAPAGTASVRVSAGATGMANSGINPQSAMFDDFSLMAVLPGVPGDYNGNGIVDSADYVVWRNGGPLQNDPTPGVQAADYTFWRSRFGATSGAGSGLGAAAVPETAAYCLALMGLAGGLGIRRRWL